jgi:hypothetical protein
VVISAWWNGLLNQGNVRGNEGEGTRMELGFGGRGGGLP